MAHEKVHIQMLCRSGTKFNIKINNIKGDVIVNGKIRGLRNSGESESVQEEDVNGNIKGPRNSGERGRLYKKGM